MKEKLLASAALVLLACTPAMAQGLDDVKHKFASVSGIVQDKCMACHSRGYDLPFYAKVPGISGIIEKDYRDGIRAMDLNQELVQRKDRPVGETVLAKMEWVILNDTMPPAKFAVVHWGSRLSDQDKKDILTWVAQTRKAHYATDAAPEHANEPIQPIPHRLPVDEAKVALEIGRARPCSTMPASPPTAPWPAPPAMPWTRPARTTPASPKASASSWAM